MKAEIHRSLVRIRLEGVLFLLFYGAVSTDATNNHFQNIFLAQDVAANVREKRVNEETAN